MKTKTGKIKLWKCPNCGRQFERKGQAHSCKPYDLRLHFKGKPEGKLLYEKLKKEVRSRIGPFKIESLECCIHFASTFTFAAVIILRDKIRVEFCLGRKLKSKRIGRVVPLSSTRFLFYIDIYTENEIDEQLIKWIEEASIKRREMTRVV